MRVVSLVPSLTEAVAAMGAASTLVGVTRYCTVGAPQSAARVGGTKNPAVDAVLALAPDVVLANAEENRKAEVEALRAAGVDVHVTLPRTVADVGPMLTGLADRLGRPGAADGLVADLARAAEEAARARPDPPVAALTLVWRKPWMGAGPGTFVDDLLGRCGFANVLAGAGERYPRLGGEAPGGGHDLAVAAEVVLLPDEPYAFGTEDLPALRSWLGDVRAGAVGGGALEPPRPLLVDGRLLTWHGPSTARALRAFTDLARGVRASR